MQVPQESGHPGALLLWCGPFKQSSDIPFFEGLLAHDGAVFCTPSAFLLFFSCFVLGGLQTKLLERHFTSCGHAAAVDPRSCSSVYLSIIFSHECPLLTIFTGHNTSSYYQRGWGRRTNNKQQRRRRKEADQQH